MFSIRRLSKFSGRRARRMEGPGRAKKLDLLPRGMQIYIDLDGSGLELEILKLGKLVYPPVLKRGNWKSTRLRFLARKITELNHTDYT